MNPQEIARATEQVAMTPQESSEQSRKRSAERLLKQAFWDYEGASLEGELSVEEFLISSYFQKVREDYISLHKSEDGLWEAVAGLRQKYTLSTAKGVSAQEGLVTTLGTDGMSLVLENAQDEEERLKKLSQKYDVMTPSSFGEESLALEDVSDESTAKQLPKVVLDEVSRAQAQESKNIAEVILPEQVEVAAPKEEVAVEVTQLPAGVEEVAPLGANMEILTKQAGISAAPLLPELDSPERQEKYLESLKELSLGYQEFLRNLVEFNESTLNENGEETSSSFLMNHDIREMQNTLEELEKSSGEGKAQNLFSALSQIRSYIAENSFPIKGGMLVASPEGYEHLQRSLGSFGETIERSFNSVKDIDTDGKLGELLQITHSDIQAYYYVISEKLRYLRDYLSR